MQINLPSNPLTNFDTFNLICSYLTLRDKMVFSYTSKTTSSFLEEHFSSLLNNRAYDTPPGKTPIQLIKYNFNRNLRVVRIPSIVEGNKEQFAQFNCFKHTCISKIEAGGKHFVAFLDNKNQALLTKASEFFAVKSKPINFQMFNNVRRVFCNSQRLFVHNLDGTVVMATPSEEEGRVFENLQMIDWTLRLPVVDMEVSKNYAVLLLGAVSQSEIRKLILMQEVIEKQKVSDKEQSNIKILVYSIQACKFYVINYPCKEVQSYCVGSNTAYFVNEQRQLLHCVLTNLNEGQTELNATTWPLMEDKQVVSVHCGLHYYIALTREENLIESWNNQKVLQWLRRQGLQNYINIFRVQKVDGKKLVNLEKRYMEDVLGITSTILQQKILLSIERHQKISYRKDELYGWGKNEAGQLATSMAFFVNKPVKIKLPEFEQNENITQVVCGWFNTLLRTSQNRIFITKNLLKKQNQKSLEMQKQVSEDKKGQKKRKKIENSDEEGEASPLSPKSPKKDKKKIAPKQQRQIQKGTEKYQQESHWTEYKPPNTPFQINIVKDILLIMQLAYQQEENKKKLRPVKAIIDKIQWDPNLNKQEFKIGYLDKNMGILEISIEEYRNSDVKEHRVIYFKRNGQIVWHRENRIDIV